MKDFLNRCFEQPEGNKNGKLKHRGPVVTISRECGCSARPIAIKLSKILTGYNYLSESETNIEWKWVNKEIIEIAARELETNGRQIKNVFLNKPWPNIHEIMAAFSSIPIDDTFDQKVISTVRTVIRRIAEVGNFIIVGRAANVIAQDIPLHLSVKLQAPLEWRINQMMLINNQSFAEAQKHVLKTDRQRNWFVEHVAGRKLNDNDFDLIFNYSTMPEDYIVDVIVNVLKDKRIITNFLVE
jgi:cytidylate kinase